MLSIACIFKNMLISALKLCFFIEESTVFVCYFFVEIVKEDSFLKKGCCIKSELSVVFIEEVSVRKRGLRRRSSSWVDVA